MTTFPNLYERLKDILQQRNNNGYKDFTIGLNPSTLSMRG